MSAAKAGAAEAASAATTDKTIFFIEPAPFYSSIDFEPINTPSHLRAETPIPGSDRPLTQQDVL
jgi:hypothetical protein